MIPKKKKKKHCSYVIFTSSVVFQEPQALRWSWPVPVSRVDLLEEVKEEEEVEEEEVEEEEVEEEEEEVKEEEKVKEE